jgi:hypothetical protein
MRLLQTLCYFGMGTPELRLIAEWGRRNESSLGEREKSAGATEESRFAVIRDQSGAPLRESDSYILMLLKPRMHLGTYFRREQFPSEFMKDDREQQSQ